MQIGSLGGWLQAIPPSLLRRPEQQIGRKTHASSTRLLNLVFEHLLFISKGITNEEIRGRTSMRISKERIPAERKPRRNSSRKRAANGKWCHQVKSLECTAHTERAESCCSAAEKRMFNDQPTENIDSNLAGAQNTAIDSLARCSSLISILKSKRFEYLISELAVGSKRQRPLFSSCCKPPRCGF
ncbi:Hypothetical predicted protein [Cloeon dipterum]|uniref:Uncharacterized protein n=1 Tax=Cloeon dipterum TaxID=197152 RepID=A0A8S1CF02_9INSE|nr:Hypothetical predicted protein [Cloeon dipterum]